MQPNMITAIIVDDESASIHHLEQDLISYPEIKILATETSLKKAKKSIIKYQPDILFLDVEFPQGNGIQLLQEVRPYIYHKMHVVFYSAFDRYMIDALRSAAFDFLLKPYQPAELQQIIERVKCEMSDNRGSFEQAMRKLLNSDGRFAVQTVNRLLLLRWSEILMFQYQDDTRCWQMTLTNLEHHRLRLSTKASDILSMSPSFIRINTDCILNFDYLSSVENNTFRCILCPPFEQIEVTASRRHFGKIRELLQML